MINFPNPYTECRQCGIVQDMYTPHIKTIRCTLVIVYFRGVGIINDTNVSFDTFLMFIDFPMEQNLKMGVEKISTAMI